MLDFGLGYVEHLIALVGESKPNLDVLTDGLLKVVLVEASDRAEGRRREGWMGVRRSPPPVALPDRPLLPIPLLA